MVEVAEPAEVEVVELHGHGVLLGVEHEESEAGEAGQVGRKEQHPPERQLFFSETVPRFRLGISIFTPLILTI